MLTPRAWWLIVLGFLLIVLGVFASMPICALLGLSLLLWLTWEGLTFSFRVKLAARSLVVQRQVRDERGLVSNLWAGRSFDVRLLLTTNGIISLHYAAIEDPLPFGVELTGGNNRADGKIGPDAPVMLTYSIRAMRAGKMRFEGARVQLADLHGLFYHVTVVRAVAVLRVLPPLVDAEGKTATKKRYNLLPPPGINRLLRPGSGSELLDLRDYIPGDPPKTIAWKVSARRDKLITKEFESEVPVRCTLFIDMSQSVRMGPPGQNALSRLVEIASAVAQANVSSRDMTGLCLFDEEKTKITKPARTRRHLVLLFNQLAEAAGQLAAAGRVNIDTAMPLAYSFAQETYPDELHRSVNNLPVWLPLFHAVPSPWISRPSSSGRLYRAIVLPIIAGIWFFIGLAIAGGVSDIYFEELPSKVREELLESAEDLPLAVLLLFTLLYPLVHLIFRDALPLLFSPSRRRTTRQRKKLAALFSQRYDLGPGGLELLFQDDELFGSYLERFLTEHHVPHTPMAFDAHGKYLFASPGKIDVLAKALLRAIGKGHDNELFVLFVDVVELEDKLAPLLRAVKVALARHHQVMVVLPWPPDVEPPGPTPPPAAELDFLNMDRGRSKVPPRPRSTTAFRDFLQHIGNRRYHRAFHRIRRTFARLQVPVLCAKSDDSVPLILDRLDRLRMMARRKR